jgi:hypothetical protein
VIIQVMAVSACIIKVIRRAWTHRLIEQWMSWHPPVYISEPCSVDVSMLSLLLPFIPNVVLCHHRSEVGPRMCKRG